jgi:hypothetical protein
MPRIERVREVLSQPFDAEHFRRKLKEGWRLIVVHWEREVEGEAPARAQWIEEVPYGLRVAGDCRHLEEDPDERRVMELMLKLLSSDKSMSQIAQDLNEHGFRTRSGTLWTQTVVFNMLPRLIEAAPHIWRSTISS